MCFFLHPLELHFTLSRKKKINGAATIALLINEDHAFDVLCFRMYFQALLGGKLAFGA